MCPVTTNIELRKGNESNEGNYIDLLRKEAHIHTGEEEEYHEMYTYNDVMCVCILLLSYSARKYLFDCHE